MKQNKIFILIGASLMSIAFVALAGIYIFQKLKNTNPKPEEPKADSSVLYSSNFENSEDLNDFVQVEPRANEISDNWQVKDGKLKFDYSITQKSLVNIIKLEKGSDWKNYRISLDFNTQSQGRIAFLVRYQNTKNYYRVNLTCSKNKKENLIAIEKFFEGAKYTLYKINSCYNIGKKNSLKVKVDGNRIDVYLNSEKVTIYGVDKDGGIGNGGFAIYTSGIASADFDNIMISKIDSKKSEIDSEKVLSGKSDEGKIDQEINTLLKEIGI